MCPDSVKIWNRNNYTSAPILDYFRDPDTLPFVVLYHQPLWDNNCLNCLKSLKETIYGRECEEKRADTAQTHGPPTNANAQFLK